MQHLLAGPGELLFYQKWTAQPSIFGKTTNIKPRLGYLFDSEKEARLYYL